MRIINPQKAHAELGDFCIIFGSFYDLDRSAAHTKFDLTEVRTHDLQIIDSICHIPETLVLTTELSETLFPLAKVLPRRRDK